MKAVFVGWLGRLSAAGGQVAFISQETIYGLFFPFNDMWHKIKSTHLQGVSWSQMEMILYNMPIERRG